MEGCGYVILYRSIGSESILVRVQAGRDVVDYVLENHSLKNFIRIRVTTTPIPHSSVRDVTFYSKSTRVFASGEKLILEL